MIKKTITYHILFPLLIIVVVFSFSCKHKQKTVKTDQPAQALVDSLAGRCRLDYKSAKALSRYMKENEFKFTWVNAKANVQSIVGEKEESFDIRVSICRDSAMLVSIQYLLGLQVAKVLVTRDSVKFVNYVDKTYFKGDFNYINNLLNADLDFDLLQAVLFGNSADFQDEESKLKPVTDRQNCHYMLSTERKRRLKRIQAGTSEPTEAFQTLTLNPENYKITRNEFVEPSTGRRFIANYSDFTQKDSVFAPYHVDIDIVAQKNATIKIDYVRIDKNTPQKVSLNIPAKYDRIQIQKK
ncbi:MAG: DUF4292 domain-containing protein [Bacteroidia bacterium]|nr:DUF4292 domain-containing protein [Bacteroidia bacterium]